MVNKRVLILQKIDLYNQIYRNNLIQNKELLLAYDNLEKIYKCNINRTTLDINFKRGRKRKINGI